MFGKLRNIAPIAMLAAYAQSPQGRAMIGKVKTYANDPENRRKVRNAVTNFTRRR